MWMEILVVGGIMVITFIGSCLLKSRTRAKLLSRQKAATEKDRNNSTDVSNNPSDILLDIYTMNHERNLPNR